MNVCDYLLAGKPPSAIALLTLEAECTYGALNSAVDRTLACLVRNGCRKGDRVLLMADNGAFWVAAYLGCLRAGLVCVPIAGKSSPEELEHIYYTSQPSFLFAEAKYRAKI